MISINLTFVFVVLNFILLVFVLKFLLFKPMIDFLDNRTKTIEESLRIAEENKKRAEDMKREHDQLISDARSAASGIIDKATVNASQESRDIINEARAKSQATVNTAREEILLEAERIKGELRSEIASMSVSLASKVLEREINADDHKAILEKSLDILGS